MYIILYNTIYTLYNMIDNKSNNMFKKNDDDKIQNLPNYIYYNFLLNVATIGIVLYTKKNFNYSYRYKNFYTKKYKF
jgi:hypothetical protein